MKNKNQELVIIDSANTLREKFNRLIEKKKAELEKQKKIKIIGMINLKSSIENQSGFKSRDNYYYDICRLLIFTYLILFLDLNHNII